jgi:hypothetical protein
MEQDDTFATKLNLLYAERAREDGREPTDSEVARHVARVIGRKVTSAYIGLLRKGDSPSPRMDVAEGICDFFHVHPAYFLNSRNTDDRDGEATAADQLQALQLAYRMSNMSEHARRVVTDVMESFEHRDNPSAPHPRGER